MAIFEVYIAPQVNIQGAASQFNELSSLKLVEDKKYIWALIFPIIWLVWNRLWFWSAIYILVSILFVLSASAHIPILGSIMSFVFGLFLFLEGRSLIVAKLERQGCQFVGVVDAQDVEIAEYKFLAAIDFNEIGQKNSNLSIDSSAEPIISVDDKSNLSNQNSNSPSNSKMGDRPALGIFSEG